MLCCADHYCLATPAGQTRSRMIEVVPNKTVSKGNWWAGPGPALPDGCQLVEGPVKMNAKGRISVEVLVHASSRLGPGQIAVELTLLTAEHNEICKQVKQLEAECGKQVEIKEQLLTLCSQES